MPSGDSPGEGILYLSYDGMLEPLGQSQVIAYLEKLSPGRRIHLISFEKHADWQNEERRAAVSRRLADAGIGWHPLRYHKSPTAPATAYDIGIGTFHAIRLVRKHRLGIVHARSYVPALIALAVKRVTGARMMFDMRGFWADERVDGGLWPRGGRLYRTAKALERRFLLAADQVVTLTHTARAEILTFPYLAGKAPPIAVIPTCADLDRFNLPAAPPERPFVLGYVGSVGTWYPLDEMLHCFSEVQAAIPESRLLIVNRSEHEMIRGRVVALGIEPSVVEIIAADHADMPAQIARMHAGLALYAPSYSRIACAPTKLAEYLACGVACLGNAGVGDVEEVLEGSRAGTILPDFSDDSILAAVGRLIALTREPGIRERCRAAAADRFSLDAGVDSYAAIYRQLEAERR